MLGTLPPLTAFQFDIVDNMFSLTVAAMGAAAVFFFSARSLLTKLVIAARSCPRHMRR